MTRELKRQDVRPDVHAEETMRRSSEECGAHALVGQTRAERTLSFSLNVDGHGFNVFVSGPAGIGKLEQVES